MRVRVLQTLYKARAVAAVIDGELLVLGAHCGCAAPDCVGKGLARVVVHKWTEHSDCGLASLASLDQLGL